MKKLTAVLLSLTLILTVFVGCKGSSAKEEGTMTVGLIQLVEHPSLDEIRTAITGKLETLATQQGIKLNIDYKNAQNDMSLINSICRNFVDDKVDLIIAIATPTAQGAASVTSDIPIVFSAVSDPIAAGLVENLENPEGNVTGTSDYINVDEIFKLADKLTPGIKSYGLIYNKAETNSVSVIGNVKAYLDSNGISYSEKLVANSGEVQQNARALFEEHDAVFAPIDNTVASAMTVLSNEAITAGKPIYVAADSMVNDGGLATVGVNYTALGELTAEMAMKVLSGTPVNEVPVEVLREVTPVVNKDTAEALGIDVSDYA